MKKDYSENGVNGWKNRQTWSVALNISNVYSLYIAAVKFVENEKANNRTKCLYPRFIKKMGLTDCRTSENCSYTGSRLDYAALNEFMFELTK